MIEGKSHKEWDVELRDMRAFVEVVRQGGFTEASKVVFKTQSTVSKSVKQLEDELGLKLLDRVGAKSTMTAAGEIVFRRGVQMLAARDDLLAELDELRDLKRGTLRVGLPAVGSDALFAPVFAEFRSRYPGIEIRLIEGGSKQMEDVLRAGDVEIAGVLQPVPGDFEIQPMWSEPVVALCSRSHPIARRQVVDFRELSAEPFILFDPRFTLHDIVIGACARSGFVPNIVAESSQISFMLKLAAGGLGITFMPKLIAELNDHEGVAVVGLTDTSITWNMTLAWRRGAFLSQAAKAWLALARETGAARSSPRPDSNPKPTGAKSRNPRSRSPR